MRIRLIAITNHSSNCYNLAMMKQIEDGASKNPEMEIADTAPDIVHIFGPWGMKSEQKVREWYKLKVPVIFTSTDGLLSLLHSQTLCLNPIGKIVAMATGICASGPKEKSILRSQYGATRIQIIANPMVTSTITEKEFADKICETYQKLIDEFDLCIRKDIQKQVGKLKEKDSNIVKICHLLLYAQYQVHRKDLRSQTIVELVQTLTTKQYDEDRVCENLKTLGIYRFAQRVMSAAQQHAALSEGFMPVPALDDDKTSQIVDIISNGRRATIQ